MASRPAFDAAGAAAAVALHVPAWPSRLHCCSGPSHAVSQQTPSAQLSVEHCEGSVQAPPWGTLTAINVNTGEIAWQQPLGVSDNLPAAIAKTGRPNVGGAIVTAGGVLFIGATDDSRFRAFNARTGAELWTYKLGASGHATPITYQGKDGRQYVAIVATGGSFLDSPAMGAAIEVFALP